MAVEVYANRPAVTTINDAGGISAGDLLVTVADASVFPATGNFRIRIESEIIIVTAVSGNDLTITRGAEGTTAASHADGTTVTHVLTRDGLKNVGGSVVIADTYANRPSANHQGRVFLPTDGFSLYRENGLVWAPSGPVFPFTDPVDGDFVWINQGGASVDTTEGGIFLRAPAAGAGANLRIRKKSAPATPYTITVFILPVILRKPFHSYGILFREAATGELHVFDVIADATSYGIRSSKFTSPTLFSLDYQLIRTNHLVNWMQISDDGVNRICRISADGEHWVQIHSIGRTDFLTADEVGFVAGAENSGAPNIDVGMTLLSWKETT